MTKIHITTIRFWCAGVILTLGMLSLFGCSSDAIPIETVLGTVTLDGQPAEDVTVTFTSKDGGTRSAIGRTNEQGTFEMITGGTTRNGVMAGEYYVTFARYILVTPDGRLAETLPLFNADGSPADRPPLTMRHLIPKRYGNMNSPLFEAVVERGKRNVYTFALESQ